MTELATDWFHFDNQQPKRKRADLVCSACHSKKVRAREKESEGEKRKEDKREKRNKTDKKGLSTGQMRLAGQEH